MTELNKINTDPDKEKILQYARSRYFREGFYKTSMSSLAADMQISKKTIYKYFPSKDKLVEEVIFEFMNYVKGIIEEIFRSKKDAISKVHGFIELLVRVSSQFGEPFLRDLRLHMPGLWEKIDAFRTKKMNTEIANLIIQGKKEKLFHNYPDDIILTIFIASIRAIVNPDFLLHNRFSYNEAASICIEILFNGILTEKGKKVYYKSINRVQQ